MSILSYGRPGPPTFVAEEGALCHDIQGLLWMQLGQGSGAYWEIFTPHGAYSDIVWSSESLHLNHNQHAVNSVFSWVSPASNTADYFTVFNNRHTIRVLGLMLPLILHTSGAISIKASIYGCQFDESNSNWPGTAIPGMQFELLSFTPTSVEPIFVPYALPAQDPLILRKGRYFIRHVWGESASVSFLSRLPHDYVPGSGTATSNRFRTDRSRTSGIDFNSSTLFDESFKSTTVGSLVADNNIAHIDFGIYGEILD